MKSNHAPGTQFMTETAYSPHSDFTKHPAGQGRWVLLATILASSMAFIDTNVLFVALPAIQAELKGSGSELLWISNAYALLLAALILVGGSLGDVLGRKRILMVGIALFAGASLACGLAPSIHFLIAARVVQGIGAALMIPGSLATLAASFDDNQRGQAIGKWSAFSAMTTILGPILGGELAHRGLWRVVFFINLPLALISLVVLYWKVVERQQWKAPAGLDYRGALLGTVGLGSIVYAFTEAPGRGLSHPVILFSLIGGLIFLFLFALVEMRVPKPMIPLHIFRSSIFSGTNVMTLFLYAALYGALLFAPLNLVQIQGYNSALAGRAILPFAGLVVVLSKWAGQLMDRYGPRLLLTVGPLIVGLGFALLARPGITAGPADYWFTFFPAFAAMGVGMGLTIAPLTATVMNSAGPAYVGSASGINNAISRTAGVLSVAILGAIALLSFRSQLINQTSHLNLSAEEQLALQAEAANLGEAKAPAGLPTDVAGAVQQAIQQAFVNTFQLIAWIATGLAWASALLAFVLLKKSNDQIQDD